MRSGTYRHPVGRISLLGFMLMTVVSADVAAQQRLSEVAGEIKLKKPDSEAVLVETGPVRSSDARQGESPEQLLILTEVYVERADTVYTVYSELMNPDRFYEKDWRSRMERAMELADLAAWSLQIEKPPQRYADAHRLIVEGTRVTAEGMRLIRTSIEKNWPEFEGAGSRMKRGQQLVTEGLGAYHERKRVDGTEAGQALEDPVSAERSIAAWCDSQSSGDADRNAHCVADQQSGFQALNSRFPLSVSLGEPEFNRIRAACRDQWPTSFANRNECELNRMVRDR